MYRSKAVIFLLSSTHNFHGENIYVSGKKFSEHMVTSA